MSKGLSARMGEGSDFRFNCQNCEKVTFSRDLFYVSNGARICKYCIDNYLLKTPSKGNMLTYEPFINIDLGGLDSSGMNNSGCFIATATMGNYNHPVVLDLRNYRDMFLSNSLYGRLFIKVYYYFSPFIARLISKSPLLKTLSLKLLIGPIHAVVKKFFLK